MAKRKYAVTGRKSIFGPRLPRTEIEASGLPDAIRQARAMFFPDSVRVEAAMSNSAGPRGGMFYPIYGEDLICEYAGSEMFVLREDTIGFEWHLGKAVVR